MQGSLPACVAACPLRCLDLVDTDKEDVEKMGQALWKIPGAEHPFPLANSITNRTSSDHQTSSRHKTGRSGNTKLATGKKLLRPCPNQQPGRNPPHFFHPACTNVHRCFRSNNLIILVFKNNLLLTGLFIHRCLSVGAAILLPWFILSPIGSPKNAWRVLIIYVSPG